MKYILGLDLGIASVGWSVVKIDDADEIIHIKDCGVRTFAEGSNPKDGKSLNLQRRNARLIRRTIRRRAGRMKKLRQFFIESGLIQENEIDDLYHIQKGDPSPWQLRSEGLDRKLSRHEWARVLTHIAKHRGFLSNRKSEAKEGKEKDEKKLLAGVQSNHRLLHEGKYRTVGEMVYKDEKFAAHKRNKTGDYTHSIQRLDIADEIECLFTRQKELKNPFASDDFKTGFFVSGAKFTYGPDDPIFSSQRPVFTGDQIEKMVGRCTFERDELRAPKRSFSAERFVLLQKLQNLRYTRNGKEYSLSPEEQKVLYQKALEKESTTYKSIAKFLKLDRDKHFYRFIGLHYDPKKTDDENEEKAFYKMTGFHAIKKAVKDAGNSDLWEKLCKSPASLDHIAESLTLYKTDDDIRERFKPENTPHDFVYLPDEVIERLLEESFTGHIHLSLKALRNILPLMERGLRYDEACTEVYEDHRGTHEAQSNFLLPSFDAIDDPEIFIVNPAVKRTLTQARKVINGIIRTYGSPTFIHLENTRDLSKSHAERKSIVKSINKNEEIRALTKKELTQEFGRANPTRSDIEKMRLYKDQDCKCAYSGASLCDAFRNNQV